MTDRLVPRLARRLAFTAKPIVRPGPSETPGARPFRKRRIVHRLLPTDASLTPSRPRVTRAPGALGARSLRNEFSSLRPASPTPLWLLPWTTPTRQLAAEPGPA